MKLADNEGNIICDLAKTKLEEGDVLVLDFKNQQPPNTTLKDIGDSIHDIFPNNKIIFLSNDLELKIINGGRKDEQGD